MNHSRPTNAFTDAFTDPAENQPVRVGASRSQALAAAQSAASCSPSVAMTARSADHSAASCSAMAMRPWATRSG